MNISPFTSAQEKAEPGYLLWLADFFSHRPYDNVQLYRAQIVLFPPVVASARRNGYSLDNATLAALFTSEGLRGLLKKRPGRTVKWLVKPLLGDNETEVLLSDLRSRLADPDAPQLAEYLADDCSEWDLEEIESQVHECIKALGRDRGETRIDEVA